MSFEEELSRGQEERSFDTLYLISYYLKFISAFLLKPEFWETCTALVAFLLDIFWGTRWK